MHEQLGTQLAQPGFADHSRLKALLVEDNPGDARLLREILSEARSETYELTQVDCLAAALQRLATEHFDLILLDLSLPDAQGLDTFRRVRTGAPRAPIIVLTGVNDEALAVRMVHGGAQDYLVKGNFDTHLLTRAMRYAIQRQQILEELEHTRREQLQIKDRFLSHVSHELRTPLTAIYQFITIMLDGLAGDLSNEQREYLEIVLNNVNQLRTMIGDLLEVTRAETGKLALTRQPISLTPLISETLRSLGAGALTKHIRLAADMGHVLPPVFADPLRVRQILFNLIDNAIKFTPEGGRITVRADIASNHASFLRVAITDTGCGISPEGAELIFERLYQESTIINTSRKGLGLGLHICKQLVVRHGGRIWVESRLGEGSTFYFTLPLFSLARLILPVVTEHDCLRAPLALIEVDATALASARSDKASEAVLRSLWEEREVWVLSSDEVLIPGAAYGAMVDRHFLLAATDEHGAQQWLQRIHEQFVECDFRSPDGTGLALSYTMLNDLPSVGGVGLEKQVQILAERLENSIKTTLYSRRTKV